MDEVHRVPEAEELRDLPRTRSTRTGCSTRPQDFVLASGKLQALLYKEEIESALRTPGHGRLPAPAISTTSRVRAPPSWACSIRSGSRRATSPRRSSAASADPTVPLARLDKRVFTTAETFEADIEVSHFGPAPSGGEAVRGAWWTRRGRRSPPGGFRPGRCRWTTGLPWAASASPLADVAAPARYRLVVGLDGTRVRERLGRVGVPAGREHGRPAGRRDPRPGPRRGRPGPPGGRRPSASPGAPGPRPGRRGPADRPGLLEHLLEHRLDQRPGAPHPGHPLRSRAPGLRRASRPTSTATGSGGTWSAGPERWSSTTCRGTCVPPSR